jgi:hypothetical protein
MRGREGAPAGIEHEHVHEYEHEHEHEHEHEGCQRRLARPARGISVTPVAPILAGSS